MKVGERGQVTIPKPLRDRFNIRPGAPVEFRVQDGKLVLQKAPQKLNLRKWKGYCKNSLAELGTRSVDDFIEDIRGR